MRWPAIPKSVRGAGGPIKVRLVQKIVSDEHGDCWGEWEPGKRLVRIEKGAPPQLRWKVLFHELTHAALDDAGVSNLLSFDGVESLCDAMATARLQEMRGQLGMSE